MNRTNNSSTKKQVKSPFCKVCFDAKKPQSVYESHWVKDREGKVTCVTLLEQECRYCYKAGHTVKFCPEVIKVNRERNISIAMEKRQKNIEANKEKEEKKLLQEKTKAKLASRGGFGALCESDEETPISTPVSKEKTKTKEEWPALPSTVNVNSAKPGMSFARALQKNKVETNKVEETKVVGFTVLSLGNNGKTEMIKPEPEEKKLSTFANAKKIINWASWSDSDDDEE
jgi:hypothetical protein